MLMANEHTSAGDTCVSAAPVPVVTVPVSPAPVYSFVFVTYGTGPIIVDAIASLVASLGPDAYPYEVIVVDNEHPDLPDRTFRHLLVDTTGVRIVRPGHNLGFGTGCNVGVECAAGELVGFLNPDVELPAGWLAPLRAALEQGAAIAAPVLVDPDGTIQSAGHRLWADGSTAPLTDGVSNGSVEDPDYASAACWLMRRKTFQELGGFDSAFHPAYYEDVDFSLRARAHGGTAVISGVRVVHHRGASTAQAAAPDTTPQRMTLLGKWPDLATTQPSAPR